MAEEKKELESDKKDEERKEEEEKKDDKKDGEEEEKKEDFEKEKETVPANKYNQALRKQREAEIRERDLKKELEELKAARQNTPPKKKEEEDDEDFYEDDEEDDKKDDKKKDNRPDPSALVDEKLKPVLDKLNKQEQDNRKKDRTAFFAEFPKYLTDAEAWQELLDEVDNSLNPNSKDGYYEQLVKAHRIVSGNSVDNSEVDNKKKELASEAASSGDGANKGSVQEEFTPEDRKLMKQWGISEDGMRAYKKKIAEGSMQVLS